VERALLVRRLLERLVLERRELVGRRVVLMLRWIVRSMTKGLHGRVVIWVSPRDRWATRAWLARSWG
jgi:hypothetical protein